MASRSCSRDSRNPFARSHCRSHPALRTRLPARPPPAPRSTLHPASRSSLARSHCRSPLPRPPPARPLPLLPDLRSSRTRFRLHPPPVPARLGPPRSPLAPAHSPPARTAVLLAPRAPALRPLNSLASLTGRPALRSARPRAPRDARSRSLPRFTLLRSARRHGSPRPPATLIYHTPATVNGPFSPPHFLLLLTVLSLPSTFPSLSLLSRRRCPALNAGGLLFICSLRTPQNAARPRLTTTATRLCTGRTPSAYGPIPNGTLPSRRARRPSRTCSASCTRRRASSPSTAARSRASRRRGRTRA